MSEQRTDVEDLLSRALEHRASTTAVSPEGWDRIEERVAGRRCSATRWVAVPALAVAVAVVLVAAAVIDRDRPDPSVAAGPAGAVYFAPGGVDGRFVLRDVQERSGPTTENGGSQRVYGRRAADGLVLDATIAVMTYPPDGSNMIDELVAQPGEQLVVRGAPATVQFAGDHTMITWKEGERAVAVVTAYLGRDESIAVARAVEFDDRGARATTLPAGFIEVYAGELFGGLEAAADRVTRQQWSRLVDGEPFGGEFSLTVHEGAGMSLDSVAWTVPRASHRQVGGAPALFDRTKGSLSWVPRRGVLLVLEGNGPIDPAVARADRRTRQGFTEDEFLELASAVAPVTEGDWRRLVAGLPDRTTDPLGPEAGEGEVVATGGRTGSDGDTEWTARARLVDGQVCLDIQSPSASGGSCGPNEVGPTGIGVVGSFGPDRILAASIGKEVADVAVELATGDPLVVLPARSSERLPVNFLVVQLPDGVTATAVVARDAGGRELSRQPALPEKPTEPPTIPPPTRARASTVTTTAGG